MSLPSRSAPPMPRCKARTSLRSRSLGLAFPGGPTRWHDVQRGIADWASDCGWRLVADIETPRPLAWWLRQPLDALIAVVATRAEERAAAKARIPVVNVSQSLRTARVPLVTFDNEAIGRQAADHLVGQGYLRGAFFGIAGLEYSRRRRAGFAARLAETGVDCDTFESPGNAGVESWQAIEGWLASLPPGTGVFAVHERAAVLLFETCRRLAIDVPDRLGLVGVGESPESHSPATPMLSSIGRNGTEVGRAACMLLDRLLVAGRPDAAPPVIIAPSGASPGQSTAMTGGDVVGRAVRFIELHIAEPFDVEHLARGLRISRRTLEKAFRNAAGETPRDRLLRMRAEAAIAVRAGQPGMTLEALAKATGFRSVRHLHRSFAAVGLSLPAPVAGEPPSARTRW